jgi:hypothetical protein
MKYEIEEKITIGVVAIFFALPSLLFIISGLIMCVSVCISPTSVGEDILLEKKRVSMTMVRVVSPPKHFYCDIQDNDLGVIYKHKFISKHFNNWRNLRSNSDFFTDRYLYKRTRGWLADYFPEWYAQFMGLTEQEPYYEYNNLRVSLDVLADR